MPFYPATDIVPGGKRRVGSNATPLHSRENHAPPPRTRCRRKASCWTENLWNSRTGLYAALYKPEGYTCSHDDGEGDLIYDLLPFQWRHRNPAVSSVGRLDKETSGLLLLTDDGKFIHRMTSPRHHVAKVYEAVTEEDIPTEAVELFASGTLTLNGEPRPCAPALLEIREPRRALLTLTEGKYHQVRRMLAAVGAPVLSLCRVSIGSLHLDSLNLKPGEWAPIRPDAL